MNTPMFATNGTDNPTALNESTFGIGQQQRADVSPFPLYPQSHLTTHPQNLYAETTFVCPSYWLTEAFTTQKRTAYKYQYRFVPF